MFEAMSFPDDDTYSSGLLEVNPEEALSEPCYAKNILFSTSSAG